MKIYSKIPVAMLIAAFAALSACNSTDDETVSINDPEDYSSTEISAFSLRTDKAVLNNLDSVFFSIDLNSARVYNADSLPYGTDVSSLGVNLTTGGSAVKAFSPEDMAAGKFKEVDLLANPSGKIDFSQGPVTIEITSPDGKNKRDYMVQVNVHKVVPDSLCWGSLAVSSLPTSFAAPVLQKAVKFGEKAFCLTSDGSSYCMSTSSDLYAGSWQNHAVSFPSAVDVATFTAADNALFILASDGTLLTSTDGLSWLSTSQKFHTIIAAYGSDILGVAENATGSLEFASYPASVSGALPAGFPISGFSHAVTLATKWSASNQVMVFGGITASGAKTGATWAFDGTRWARLAESLPAASGYAVTNCTICETDTVSWRMKTSDVLLAFGGVLADGTMNRNVYISRDMGMSWKKADQYLQLPEEYPAVSGADILTFYTTLYPGFFGGGARSGSRSWIAVEVPALPSIYVPSYHAASMVVRPGSTWDCPFMYMFGGIQSDGALQNAVWRGVVNHFTFQPLR